MQNNRFELELLINGRPAKEYIHDGRTYVEARKGTKYTLRFRNNTVGRVLAVMTVDGLSVMDGAPGDYDGGGYIIEPNGSIDVPGWRLNDSQVAKFFFAEPGKSYAELKNQPRNVGVIGCAVFFERPSVIYRGGEGFLGSADEVPVTLASTKGVGTGFGEAVDHQVTRVNFRREPNPVAVLTLNYDTREGLKAKGVNLRPRPQVALPDPFPGKPTGSGCIPPTGWRG